MPATPSLDSVGNGTKAASQPPTLATSGGQPYPPTSNSTTPRCVAAAAQPTATNRANRTKRSLTMAGGT